MHTLSGPALVALSILVPGILAPIATASERAPIPFPMQPAGSELSLRADVALDLAGREHAVLTGMPLPGGAVDVLVERVRTDLSGVELRVDGQTARWIDDPLASSWRGRIVGVPDSQVFLGFSSAGSRGWVQAGGELWHLLASPGAAGGWSSSVSRFATEDELLRAGRRALPGCDARPRPGAQPAPLARGPGSMPVVVPPSGDTYLCRMSVETDFQLFQRFNDLAAEQAYLNQLMTATSSRFDLDVGAQIQLAYLGLHTNANDGWTSGDTGAGSGAMLDEFRNAWAGNIPNAGNLAHFLSGAGLGGGVAYVDVLCDSSWGFGVSGDLAGNTPFPVTQGPLNWDFFVFAHETGHNFGTWHTHDYCPPLDQCSPSFGQCQTAQVCITNGTIMSYCHLCTGGMTNIAPIFHPETAQVMRWEVQHSCLPVLCAGAVNYCVALPNSYEPFGATISSQGSNRISANDLELLTSGVPPGTSGMYFYGQSPAFVPFGNGYRCVGNPLFRLPIQVAGMFGEVNYRLDYNALPAGGSIAPGQTWNFQLWFRNPAGGGAGFNLSDGLRVQFCP
jgi:hypothetical protein